MMIYLRNLLYDFLNDPNMNYAFVWFLTVFFASLAVLATLFIPNATLSAVCVATYLILQGWRWYYEEWIENSIYPQNREAIGDQAIIVNLRIAVSGAAAGIVLSMVLGLMSKIDLTSTILLLAYFVWIVAIPISFVSGTVKRILVYVLKEVCGVSFDLAFFWMGLTTSEDYLDSRYKQVNTVAKKLFAAISGYSSNLTLLHDTDYILSHLPTRR